MADAVIVALVRLHHRGQFGFGAVRQGHAREKRVEVSPILFTRHRRGPSLNSIMARRGVPLLTSRAQRRSAWRCFPWLRKWLPEFLEVAYCHKSIKILRFCDSGAKVLQDGGVFTMRINHPALLQNARAGHSDFGRASLFRSGEVCASDRRAGGLGRRGAGAGRREHRRREDRRQSGDGRSGDRRQGQCLSRRRRVQRRGRADRRRQFGQARPSRQHQPAAGSVVRRSSSIASSTPAPASPARSRSIW